ncbi:hypothetical protein [Pseudomonas sp. ATCC 13867]|uniref:hypothetical protein n=1 Tax=Pseudomonas sp. ATCC 13867 TaxID=1294143 RepID=UPI0012FECC37|nr:hypothetical protein [Pseudomonas sp. ATCC 13867]
MSKRKRYSTLKQSSHQILMARDLNECLRRPIFELFSALAPGKEKQSSIVIPMR